MTKAERTRNLIIEKTAIIFNKKGYEGTSISDLTKATGLTKGSIYGNFEDKNEVAIEAFRYNYKQLTKSIREEIIESKSAREKLLAFIKFYQTRYEQVFENGGCVILNTSIDADDGNEKLKREVIKALKNWRQTIIRIVQDGIREGEFNRIDPKKFAHKMIALVEGSIFLAKTLNQPQILLDNVDILKKEVENLNKK